MEQNIRLANSLESMAIYFINGIADDKIVYNSINVAYRQAALMIYPFIWQSIKENPSHYTNLRELYALWESRKLMKLI